ncbi:MAG: hypothetical protein LUQ71_10335 [Methanoregula sp.]|nr:hypothetical protein [Methanoregula sp.]
MNIKLDESDRALLENAGLNPGEYPAEGDTDFIFPSDKKDFVIRVYEENGGLYAEIPDDIKPANDGEVLDLTAGEDHSDKLAGKIVAIFV